MTSSAALNPADAPLPRRFRDRVQAGQFLAQRLLHYADQPDVLVLALPRGGVPVAAEVAKVLHAPLDICLVRKLGVPNQPELAMGAIASNHVMVLNQRVIDSLNITANTVQQVAAEEQAELERRDRLYRVGSAQGSAQRQSVQGRTVILIDDGIATGSTLQAAIALLRQQQPQRLVVATPVAPPSTATSLESLVDETICLLTPEPLRAIGMWYDDFRQTSDAEVCELLESCCR
jgi:putative phosphoribosyl transferase